ncbi:MAG: type II toxin-antitoxin system VapC family toxin [Terracidiphilus sp.]
MILADANIWIDYFRSGDPQMQTLLLNDQVVMHPCLAAELALGSMRNRTQTLARLDAMPQARLANLPAIRQMIEIRGLYAKGIGLTDAHLVASCLITPGAKLWTRDTALRSVAKALGIDAGLA